MTDEELEKIIQMYQQELAELKENRKRKAARRANMTEEELIADMVAEAKVVAEDAEKSGVRTVTFPSED